MRYGRKHRSLIHKKGDRMILFENVAERLGKEYQCFLDYLEQNEVKLSKRTGHIGKKDCFALNGLFDIVQEKYHSCGRSQDYYTVIDFFCFFSVRAGILQITKINGKGMTIQKSERYQLFCQMSAIEQYILMMAVWLGEYQEALGKSYSVMGDRVFRVMRKVRGEEALLDPFGGRVTAWGCCYISEIRLLALFQLIRIEWLEEKEEDKENKFRIKALYQTEEGRAWIELWEKQDQGFWYNLDVSTVLTVIKNIIKDDSANIEEKLMSFWAYSVETGNHTIEFKIVIGSCIRKIIMGDQFTLDDLHYLIQKSVSFDMDHLYYFQIGSGTSRRRYFAPECEDELWHADTTFLAELLPYEGMQFEYMFDFGDEWHFQITVQRISSEHTEECVISRIKGEAPEQYSGWEQ
ncbi:MAG: plasmid pRiA4b ORF-3 family protein [Lachnospiraceae bacterium]|nr:plasmid pRiA4b ORF-3 family protein [Lachnospiraceae bacterium]